MLQRLSAYSLATGPAVSNYTLCGGKFPFQVPFLGTTWAINFVMANRTADVLCARLGRRISLSQFLGMRWKVIFSVTHVTSSQWNAQLLPSFSYLYEIRIWILDCIVFEYLLK